MKRMIACFLVILLFGGCTPNETVLNEDSLLLTQGDWEGTDTSCTNRISFAEDSSFGNSCACGSPVGDGDLAEQFRYYSTDGHTVTLLDSEGEIIETGRILYLDDFYLVIDLWDMIYTYENLNTHRPTVQACALPYTGTEELTKPFLTILGYENNILTVTAYDYDGDAADDYVLWELPVSEDIEFTDVIVIDDNGDVSMETKVLPESEYAYIGEFYTGGYFTFNQDGQVTSVVFYGETIIQG